VVSYCRFNEEGASEVYLYPSIDGGIVCCSCRLTAAYAGLRMALGAESAPIHDNRLLPTRSAALAHLALHRAAGHAVPARAEDALRSELATLGEAVPPVEVRRYEDLPGGPAVVTLAEGHVVLTYDATALADREAILRLPSFETASGEELPAAEELSQRVRDLMEPHSEP
jgi:hypothetical protein